MLRNGGQKIECYQKRRKQLYAGKKEEKNSVQGEKKIECIVKKKETLCASLKKRKIEYIV